MKNINLDDIKKQISDLRKLLECLYTNPDIPYEDTLAISQELDKLILLYQKIVFDKDMTKTEFHI